MRWYVPELFHQESPSNWGLSFEEKQGRGTESIDEHTSMVDSSTRLQNKGWQVPNPGFLKQHPKRLAGGWANAR